MSALADRGVAVTRAEGVDGPLSRLLAARGARVVDWASIRFAPAEDRRPLDEALDRLDDYDWVVLTSARAVAAIAGAPGRRQGGPRFAAVGSSTASAIAARGWPADRVATGPGAASLVDAFRAAGDAAGTRILLPASAQARAELADGLAALGAVVHRVEAYRTVPAPLDAAACRRDVTSGRVQAVTFASPSALDGLGAAFAGRELCDLLAGVAVASIGPTTSRALRALGREPDAEAAPSTFDGLVQAVERALGKAAFENRAALAATAAGGRTS